MEVNQILESDGFTAPKSLVWPNSKNGHQSEFNFPSDLSAEEYYELLLKNMHQSSKASSDENDGDSSGSSGSGSGSGKMKKKALSGQFDEHHDKNRNYDKEAEELAKKMFSDKYGMKGADPDFTPASARDETRNVTNMRESIVSAAQQVERSRGTIPDFIKKMIESILTPEIDWREQLAADITTSLVNKTTWNRPNRRFVYSGTYLPSHQGENVKIAVGIDTSGSCAQDCVKFLSEVVGIAKTFGDYEITLIQCDTEIKDVQVFNADNPLDPEHNGIEFKGFGGTVLKPIFNYVKDNELDVDKIIVFTDGYCETFEESDAPEIPTLWVITAGGDDKALKFGNKIFLKNESKD